MKTISKKTLRMLFCMMFMLSVTLISSSLAFAARPPIKAGEAVKLRYSSWLPAKHTTNIIANKWQKKVTELTKGKVTFTNFYGKTLIAPGTALQNLGKGIVDIAALMHFYYPSLLPLTCGSNIVYLTNDPYAQIKALTELYDTFKPMQNEWNKNNVLPLSFVLLESTILASKDKITKVEDLKGKKIRAVGWSGKAFQKLGASPTAISMGDLYVSMQRGVISALTSTPFRNYVAGKLFEVAPYMTDPGMGLFISSSYSINKDVWEALPNSYKTAFQKVHDGIIENEVSIANEANKNYIRILMADKKATPVAVSTEEKEKWHKACVPVLFDEWVKEVSATGLPAKEWLEVYQAKLRKYAGKSNYVNPFGEWLKQYNAKNR